MRGGARRLRRSRIDWPGSRSCSCGACGDHQKDHGRRRNVRVRFELSLQKGALMKTDARKKALWKGDPGTKDCWAIIATALSAGFIGWIVIGTPERSALRRDQH